MKKTVSLFTKAILSALFALFAVCALPDMNADAADIPAVTSLRQTNSSANSIGVAFDASLDTTVYYSIQVLDPATNTFVERGYTTNGTADLYDLPNSGASYSLRVVPYRQTGSLGSNPNTTDKYTHDEGTPSEAIEVVTTPYGRPENFVHTSSTETTISLSWSPVAGATSYIIAYAPYGVSEPTLAFSATNAFTLTNLGKDTKYHIEISSIRDSASGYRAISLDTASLQTYAAVSPSKASKPVLEYWWNTSSEVELTTKTLSCADGYEYQINTYKNKKVASKSTESVSTAAFIKNKNLKKYRFCKVRVRGFIKTSNGTKCYGKWSDWKYISSAPEIKGKVYGTKAKANWSKVTGASRYAVYVSKSKDSGYKKIATTKKTSYTITKYGKKKFKKYKTYYLSIVPEIKVGKKYVSGMPQNYYISSFTCK